MSLFFFVLPMNIIKQKGEESMKLKIKDGAKTTWIKAAAIGSGCALGASVVLTALVSVLVLNGSIKENGSAYAVFAIRALSVAIGALIGTGLAEEKLLPVIGVITAGYILILLAFGIVLFDGSFYRFGAGLMSSIIGGAVAAIIRLKPKKSKNHMPVCLR